MTTLVNLQKQNKHKNVIYVLALFSNNNTFWNFSDCASFSRSSQHVERVGVFFHNKVFLYILFYKTANWNSLFTSQVVFEVVTSGHPGYVAIDEVKVLGHPCSKYLHTILVIPLNQMCYCASINVQQMILKLSENNVTPIKISWVCM